ncbi:major facilitator superfamily domain-containing protein 6-like [Argiope bruennichi]|uniref:Major facilitator superfamily like protein n=1 Tax=Argiope bruennichi TaxID=94029 RepID=A0A8T0EIA5_ARGBR|nr:major facilitator superfamily domain-containing protein 6-like [Argiope bruennichi]XP_055952068.1 major facilitator superfamily domain-containing protein 6-like [Argiope bruennichi]XP_055952069.1 major facilitator superfamily domain-containing protein 6-like [Argiope bruennichi]KAF8771404.1 Major facilitator superfamily like protein [Argiope bruennichi]
MASSENSKVSDSSPMPKSEKMESRLIINVSPKLKINICKPLIPLKIALTLWFTASMGMTAYITLFFKQRGLTLEEISFMYLIGNLSQFVFNTACGVISDKIRRPICMTVLSMLIAGALASSFTFIPKVSETIEENQSFSSVNCGKTDYDQIGINRTCDISLQVISCEEMCSQACCKDASLDKLKLIDKFVNISESSFSNGSEYDFDWCMRGSKTVLFTNDTRTLCRVYQKTCAMACDGYETADADRKTRVLFLIAIAILFLTFDENVFRFLDILANYMSNAYDAEYGRQIFWSNIGALTGPSLVALIIQQASVSEEVANYESSLYFYAAVALLTIATVCTLNVSQSKPNQEMSKAAIKLFRNIDFLFFVSVLFVLGGTWGFLMSYHNLFLSDIGTPIYMMGLLDTFSGICGLPVLVSGKWLTDKIGHTNVFTLALLGYFFKCFGYSFLRTAWPVFFLELFMIFSYHLLWIGTMDFCAAIGPDGLKGTVIMLAGAVHFSLGRALGSFAGGLLMSGYGAPAAFQIIGAVNGVAFILYSIYNYFRKSRKIKKIDVS